MKDTEEEWSKMVKHLGDEIPPHADVWREVRYTKTGRQPHSSQEQRAHVISQVRLIQAVPKASWLAAANELNPTEKPSRVADALLSDRRRDAMHMAGSKSDG